MCVTTIHACSHHACNRCRIARAQVEGAASKAVPRAVGDGVLWRKGEAWAYRRECYATMAQLLGMVRRRADHQPNP